MAIWRSISGCARSGVTGQEVRLTSTEFRLLEVLVRNVGMTMPHHVLLDRVWLYRSGAAGRVT